MAITWLIIAVVISSFDGVELARRTAYIFQKQRERMPALADRNSSATIVLPCPMRWVFAAKPHLCPRSVFSALFPIGGMSMYEPIFLLKTPTAKSSSAKKVASCNFLGYSALTLADPSVIAVLIATDKTDNCQTPENPTLKIYAIAARHGCCSSSSPQSCVRQAGEVPAFRERP